VWHWVEFDTDNVSGTLSRDQDTGITTVTYRDISLLGTIVTAASKAPSPAPAAVNTKGDATIVSFEVSGASGQNPLAPPAPPPVDIAINYRYVVKIDRSIGRIQIDALYDHYPWHEFKIDIEGYGTYSIWAPPSGRFSSPADLGMQPRTSTLTINVPELIVEECT
jgi:hypothetical protein